ncbi:hypothetical protein NDU88_007207 [Pleurodeles waltl]|uniref:Uncharacterized protein n=1 Tax=Pleurodeles waltl TaxID=8319 RepID=A0AAV7N597_PLEWA|nr:hypothetical protein NDU88_007207 [Pleurodeles waltl]
MGKPGKKKDTIGDAGAQWGCPASPPTKSPRVGEDEGLSEGPSLGDIMQAITFSRESLETKIDSLVVDLGLLREDQRRLEEQVMTTERTLEALNPGLTASEERITKLVCA